MPLKPAANPDQSRIFTQASERDASRIIDILEPVFETEGYALTTMEIDEDAGLWEASLYVPSDAVDTVFDKAMAALADAYPGLTLQVEALPDIDWVAKSLEGLQPVRAGRFLVHGSHDRHRVRPSDIGIEIEASQAFGTGHHGTTAGCLEMIGKVLRTGRATNALDLGTGSGVLAIAARKLAPIRVLATDIDPIATTVARQNARLNGVAASIEFATAPGFHAAIFRQRGRFDLIIANILAKPLMQMAPQMNAHLARGGTLVLSGILAGQRRKVLAAYATQGLFHRETLWRNGWVTIRLGRQNP